MMLTFILLSVVLTTSKPIEISTPISETYSYDATYNLKHKGEETKWNCAQIDSETRTNTAVTFQFTVSSKQEIELSTCHETTTFPSRLVLSQSFNDNSVSNCVDATNGDPNGLCDGHRSKLIFTAEKDAVYYVTVMSLTNEDLGNFRLTIRAVVNPKCNYCDEAMEITFPKSVSASITEDMGFIGNAHGLKRGYWFTFTALQKEYVIDTCSKNTQQPTTIYLYNDKIDTTFKCMSDMPILEVSDGCGSNARLYYDQFEVGKKYFVFVFLTEDIASKPITGSFEIQFRSNGGDNEVCANAYTITDKPYNAITDMRGYKKNNSPCYLNSDEYGAFYAVRGDGKRYIFHTCFTGSTQNDKTRVEMISGDCNGCMQQAGTACGNDEMIMATLEDGELYKFRVVTTNPANKVRVGFMQIDVNDNFQCETARVMNMTDLGDQYTQYLIGNNQQKSSHIKCGTKSEELLGGWYKYTAGKEDVTIMHGIYSYKPTEFKGFMAIMDSCSSCIEYTQDYFISQDLVIPSGQSRYVFATSTREGGVGNKYGVFMYWAVRSTNRGGSYEEAYTASAPFTGIFAIGEHNLTIECDHAIPNLSKFPGVAIKYQQPAGTTYTVSTCGSETVVSTMVEIATETTSKGIYDCYATNDVNDCGLGSTITTSEQNTYYALVGINPYSAEIRSVLRFNLYEDKQEASSQCVNAEVITSIPSSYYSYTTKAAPSTSKCDVVTDGMRGKWFKYTPKEDMTLSILTDDVTTFNTQIGVYTSCAMVDEESVPGECVKGASSLQTPVGQHGTHLEVNLEEDKTYYIFVGGAKTSEHGIMRVKFAHYEGDDEYDNDDELTGGEIFAIIFASFLLLALLVGLVIFIGYIVHNKLHATESQFNTF